MLITTIREKSIGQSDKLAAAKATLDLRLQEVELAQKAVREAQDYLDSLIDKRFKEMNIKVVDGEAIFIPDYDLLYFWDGEKLRPLPTTTLRASYEG